MKKFRIRRVDVQVSIFSAVIVLTAVMGTFYFQYRATYGDMIRGLADRAYAIYNYVDNSLDKTTFDQINSAQDKLEQSYLEMKESLESVKTSSDVRYLYTAKRNEQGEFVYIVDGLPSDAKDFRNPGDPIEPEIHPAMQRALDGEVVLPDEIKDTTWGKVFVTYFPIHSGEEVVGVLGMEFEAEHQYDTFRAIRIFTPIAALLACAVAMGLALLLFRRISNPTYRDLANTDQLTQLKNRNAYDVDLRNLIARRGGPGMGIVVLDLNNLKLVNDQFGHQAGDAYIRAAAEAIRRAISGQTAAYRVGGDEFVLLVPKADASGLTRLTGQISEDFSRVKPEYEVSLSIAMGYALFNREKDQNLSDTYRRADQAMYHNKETRR